MGKNVYEIGNGEVITFKIPIQSLKIEKCSENNKEFNEDTNKE